MQRHHLLPRQLLKHRGLRPFFAVVDPASLGFEDFRRNGLLLPSEEALARRLALPLHRGPHREYNDMVAARFGEIEREWSVSRKRKPKLARINARLKLVLLQQKLRDELLSRSLSAPKLNRRDRLGHGTDFTDLDQMALQLWDVTEPA